MKSQDEEILELVAQDSSHTVGKSKDIDQSCCEANTLLKTQMDDFQRQINGLHKKINVLHEKNDTIIHLLRDIMHGVHGKQSPKENVTSYSK